VYAEASTVLRTVAVISSLTVGIWRSLRKIVFVTYQHASTIMRKVSDCKRPKKVVCSIQTLLSNYVLDPEVSVITRTIIIGFLFFEWLPGTFCVHRAFCLVSAAVSFLGDEDSA
jgi:hypothetical protein